MALSPHHQPAGEDLKGDKERCKVIEFFSSEESLISVVYLILRTENEKLSQRRLRGFRNLEWEEG